MPTEAQALAAELTQDLKSLVLDAKDARAKSRELEILLETPDRPVDPPPVRPPPVRPPPVRPPPVDPPPTEPGELPSESGTIELEAVTIPDIRNPRALLRADGTFRDLENGVDFAANGRHPWANAIRELYPDSATYEDPFEVLLEAGGRFDQWGVAFVGGGYSSGAAGTIKHENGLPLFLAIGTDGGRRLAGDDRARFLGLHVQDKYNAVGLLRMLGVEVEKHRDQSWTPIRMNCGSNYSTGYLELEDVDLYSDLDGVLKWGAQWSDGAESLICRRVGTPEDDPEEHDHYVKSKRGPVQFLEIRSHGGNRTWGQFTAYDSNLVPGGSLLIQALRVDDQGQSWEPANGGSTVTLWYNPHHPEVLEDVVVEDSRYGAFVISCQPGTHADRYLGLWHHRHVVLDGTTWNNRTEDPGEFMGDRSAVSWTGAGVIELRGHNLVTGDLQLGSSFAYSTAENAQPVGRYLWSPGARLEVEGRVLWFNRNTGKYETLAEGSASQPLKTDEVRAILEATSTHPVGG